MIGVQSPPKDKGKVVKVSNRIVRPIGLEISPEQYEALQSHIEALLVNRAQWIREAIAQRYEQETGKPFPPSPKWGGSREKKKDS